MPLLSLLLLHLLAGAALADTPPTTHDRYAGPGAVGRVDLRPGSKLIALTFDDGPSARTTATILDELARRHLHATFFVNAYRLGGHSPTAERQRELLREEIAGGHLVGNHTFDHARLSDLSAARQEQEIVEGERGITRVLGARPWLFRPPFGRMAPAASKVLARRGYAVVLWNLSSEDPYLRQADKVVRQVMRELARDEGGVLLMHDTHPWTVEALPRVLDAIDEENCRRVVDGKPPYLIVGLDRFLRLGYGRPPSAVPPGGMGRERGVAAAERQTEMAMVEAAGTHEQTRRLEAADAAARALIAETCRAQSAEPGLRPSAPAPSAPAKTAPSVQSAP